MKGLKGTLQLGFSLNSDAWPAPLIGRNCPQLSWEMERGPPVAWLVSSCAVDWEGEDSFLPAPLELDMKLLLLGMSPLLPASVHLSPNPQGPFPGQIPVLLAAAVAS